MKLKTILLLFLIVVTSCSKSDNDSISPTLEIEKGKIPDDINVNGAVRDYIVYVPESYTGNTAYPLLFAFHGFGGDMESSYANSKFHLLSESEDFIVVHPNGTSGNWNAVTPNNNVDVDFVENLIAKLEQNYNIDSSRIYSAGMSNGGFFSFLLACRLSDKIAAIGSVTGLMFQRVLTSCSPSRAVPVIQIHGTEDSIVDYDGVDTVIQRWIDYNNTDTTAIVENIPNIDLTDGSTVERFIYANGDNGTEVQHLKITDGNHHWPGYEGNMDINASEEVWKFLRRFNINGKIE